MASRSMEHNGDKQCNTEGLKQLAEKTYVYSCRSSEQERFIPVT
jgi:hypothetical protein